MNTLTTQGVTISVETFYQPDYSKPLEHEFMFAYRVTIDNFSHNTIKLVSRHWVIVDAHGNKKEVIGNGVVGQQPTLQPGESHQYISGSNLKTELGKMSGSYLMSRVMDGSEFYVRIPEFRLVAPFLLN